MTKQKEFSLKIIQALVSIHQNNMLLHPFSWTVMIFITVSHKNIKYCFNIQKLTSKTFD